MLPKSSDNLVVVTRSTLFGIKSLVDLLSPQGNILVIWIIFLAFDRYKTTHIVFGRNLVK